MSNYSMLRSGSQRTVHRHRESRWPQCRSLFPVLLYCLVCHYFLFWYWCIFSLGNTATDLASMLIHTYIAPRYFRLTFAPGVWHSPSLFSFYQLLRISKRRPRLLHKSDGNTIFSLSYWQQSISLWFGITSQRQRACPLKKSGRNLEMRLSCMSQI